MTRFPLLFLLLFLAPPASAGEHLVEYALPRGAGRGEVTTVHFFGVYLEEAVEVVSYQPGLKFSEVRNQRGVTDDQRLLHGGKVRDVVTAKVEIARDCPLGEHLLRVRTRTLLSEPVTFWVGPFPTVIEAEGKRGENDNAKYAQIVTRNSTVNGRILPGEDMDRDCFAIDLKKGERLSADLEAVRLGTQHFGGENDCILRLLSPEGSELARSDDTTLTVQDPRVSVVVPRDGRYVVEVSQQMHTPGQHCYYRLHIGTFAQPTTAFPLGGRPGEKLSLKLHGDPVGTIETSITLPQEVTGSRALRGFHFHYEESGQLTPTGLPLRVTAHRNVLESDAGQPNELPVAFNGTIGRDGEVDRWRFSGMKGERLDVRVFARGLGSPLDSKITIRRATASADSTPLATNDDGSLMDHDYWTCHHLCPKTLLDSALSFVVPETGDYLLEIEDTRGSGGAEHHYRIEIDRHVDGVHPYVKGNFAFKIPRSVAFTVPRGNRWTLSVSLAESLGTKFSGDVLLEAEGLPAGVTMIAPRYTKGLRQMPVQFIASADATPGTSRIRLIAKSADGRPIDGSPQQNFTYVDRRGGLAWHAVFVDEFMLAVVDPAPFQLECATPSISLARNGEITLDLKIRRDTGFDEPLELQADWLPPGVEKGPPLVIAKGQSTAQLRLRATANALDGTWPITVTGTTVNGDILSGTGCRLVTTPIISLLVSDPYLSVNFHRAAIERGQRGTILADLTHNKPFAGTATATLLRLPHGVRLLEPMPRITAKDKSCVFYVEATKDALVGPYKEIAAEVTIVVNGQPIRQQSGNGVLRIDPERGSK